VLEMTIVAPSLMPCQTPSRPKMTSSVCGMSRTRLITTSLARATSRQEAAAAAPSAFISSTASRLKSYTVSGRPLLTSPLATSIPMFPRPIKPILIETIVVALSWKRANAGPQLTITPPSTTMVWPVM